MKGVYILSCAIINMAVQNGVAGIWYNYAVGHSVSARGGFLRRLPDEARSPRCTCRVSDGSMSQLSSTHSLSPFEDEPIGIELLELFSQPLARGVWPLLSWAETKAPAAPGWTIPNRCSR